MTTVAQSKKTLQSFYEPILQHLDEVKGKFKAVVPPSSQLLAESLAHSLDSKGKFLRPAVALLASGATGDIDDGHLEVAAVSEMIHVATLLHDDVLDDADLRRGKKTVRSIWGNTVSILSGDYLLAQASRKLAQVGNIRVVGIFSDVLADLCDGEVEQIRSSYNVETVNWDSYYKKSICKTATLFAASCEAAGVLNGLPEDHIQRLRQFGTQFGIAFQIVDDLLDYTSSEEEMGKPVFDDLKNGLLNAPILLALESKKLDDPDRERLKELISTIFNAKDSCEAGQSHTDAIRQFLKETEAVEQTQALAEDFIHKAQSAIAFLPDSREKKAMMDLSQFVIERHQ